MAKQTVWSIEELVERTGRDWPVRAQRWAIGELDSRAPERLVELSDGLLEQARLEEIGRGAAYMIARELTPEGARDEVSEREPTPELLPLFARSGDPRGHRPLVRHREWAMWADLNRDDFVDWYTDNRPDADDVLVGTLVDHLVKPGANDIVGAVIGDEKLEAADMLGARLHTAATSMAGAFTENAGARGARALRSPYFDVPKSVEEGFQEIGNMPPGIPRGRFAPRLQEIWGILVESVKGERTREVVETLEAISTAAVTMEGPEVSPPAIRLSNRALAAAILRAGVDGAFAEATPEEQFEAWLSFAPADFGIAHENLLGVSGEEDPKLDETSVDLAIRAIEAVDDEGLASALKLAWIVLTCVEEGREGAATRIGATIDRRLDTPDAHLEAVRGEGYRELLAIAPEPLSEVARRGLDHPADQVRLETMHGLESSSSRLAVDLLHERFDRLIREFSSPYVARALALIGAPESFDVVKEAWAPGEEKLASYVLAVGEIAGREVPEAIEAEGLAAYEVDMTSASFAAGEMERTLETAKARFRAVLRCTECERAGSYDVPKMVLDPRALGDGALAGHAVPNRPITCKFCGAEEQYVVDEESKFPVFLQLVALDRGDEDARVARGRLELWDGRPIATASQAMRDAEELARREDSTEAWLDFLRVAELFGEETEVEAIRQEVLEHDPEALARWDASDPMEASHDEVVSEMERAAHDLGRKEKSLYARCKKVGRYGVVACWVSDDGSSPGIGVAVTRKMPKGRVGFAWAVLERRDRRVRHVGAEFGLERDEVQGFLDAWKGPPFVRSEPEVVDATLGTALRKRVGAGAPISPEFVAVWPFFASLLGESA